MNIDLAFDTKTMNIAGSQKNNASLIPKEAYAKGDPAKSVHNVAVLDLETLESNIVKMLKQAIKSKGYWYNIRNCGPSGLNNVLGLDYNMCIQIMINLNLFKQVKQQVSPEKTGTIMVTQSPYCA